MLQVRDPVHGGLDGNGNLLLHLLGGPARPLRDHLHVVIGYVGIRFHGQVVKRNGAPDQQQNGRRHHHQAVVERVVYQGADHGYCSAVFCRTSAFETTRSPGAMPDTISCMLGGIVSPPVTSTRRNVLPPAGT